MGYYNYLVFIIAAVWLVRKMFCTFKVFLTD